MVKGIRRRRRVKGLKEQVSERVKCDRWMRGLEEAKDEVAGGADWSKE